MLDSIRIASPCTADWNQMVGNDTKRFCSQCKLNVHDISAMTSDQALDLLRAAGKGRLCVRYYRRADGKVLTQDCPKGLKRRMRLAWVRAAALFTALWTSIGCTRSAGDDAATQNPVPIEGTPEQGAVPVHPEVRMGEMEMGDVLVPAGTVVQQPVKEQQPEILMGKIRAPQPIVPPK